jgi:hypothetical protein
MWRPSCMTTEELDAWLELAAPFADRRGIPAPCVDCPASWARERRLEHRCNGHPRSTAPRIVGWSPGPPPDYRGAILAAIAGALRTPHDVADQVGLSVDKVRVLLGDLEADGLVRREPIHSGGRGAPRLAFTRASQTA